MQAGTSFVGPQGTSQLHAPALFTSLCLQDMWLSSLLQVWSTANCRLDWRSVQGHHQVWRRQLASCKTAGLVQIGNGLCMHSASSCVVASMLMHKAMKGSATPTLWAERTADPGWRDLSSTQGSRGSACSSRQQPCCLNSAGNGDHMTERSRMKCHACDQSIACKHCCLGS